MFKNYLKTAFRNLSRYRGYSFINLLGLAIGMACCFVIMLYIQDEFSYDRYPEQNDRIYRLVLDIQTPDRGDMHIARTPPPWAPSLADDYPEVENYVRIKTPLVSWLVSYPPREKIFHEKGFYFADESIFDFFSFRLLAGDPATALKEPNTLVLTESAARRYFGDEDPMGKSMRLDNAYDFLVTGVMQDVPRNSHITFDILASFSTLSAVPIYGDVRYATWRNGFGPDLYTYLKLQEGYFPEELEKKMPEFLDRYIGRVLERLNLKFSPQLQALTEIHLHSNLEAEIKANSDIRYIYIFSAIALFVMLIACINFMNLSTARSASRAQEVGMRKVIGAQKKQLILQFFGESIFMAFLALVVALLLLLLLLPLFNSLAGKNLTLSVGNPVIVLLILVITAVVGFLSGSYPALFLSSFQPVAVFRGSLKAGRANVRLRKFLVVFQFTLSIIFIIGTVLVYMQLHFVRNKELGFDKEQVVVLPLGDPRARQIYRTFKDRVLQSPDVLAVSGTSSVPGGLIGFALMLPEGASAGEEVTIESFMVDEDFISVMGIDVVAGRSFSREYATDTMEAFILNEAGAKYLGWENLALDKQVSLGNFKRGRVIGVVRDFHTKSLHQRIEPLLLHIAPDPDAFLQLVVRIAPGNYERTLKSLEEAWEQVYPLDPFIYSFLDDDFDSLYRTEKQRGRIFLVFSLLAVFIACLGLLGLASFTAEQKTKEIGIRKVLGASTFSIVVLLSWAFLKLVLLANIIAWPLAYFFMLQWLTNFAYRIKINPGIFALAGFLALLIALATVSFQAVKSALADPAASIRTE